ncbi:putative uncharacterized protein DDB_G0279653 isoform X3 [Musca domestica]|uniref:Uncharacterized protein n=1 Tax=Musca domestica TaxID=7370 RepID=A0A9J7DG18_MUSDO|nr:putative uncharacterized protein DDB_G0279653 isoform X3 [Musca domestica]
MDAKRRNPSTSSITHHPKSAEHQAVHVKRSKAKVVKNPSEVSLTPSQIAEQDKLVGRKNPLDALSKVNVRQQMTERRSGLQEVDEEYLKQNVFQKTQFQRNATHNETYSPNVNSNQSQAQQQHQQMNQQRDNTVSISGDNQGNLNKTSVPASHQHQQQMSSKPCTVPTQQILANTHHQQHSTYHQQTPSAMSPSPFNASSMPEPEMCTTCPNCQTTIYLVPAQTTNPTQQTSYEAQSSAAAATNAQSEAQAARGPN